MNIEMFEIPKKHPYGMLSSYDNANQKEGILAWMLKECIRSGSLENVIKTKYDHPDMVKDGLLNSKGLHCYALTTKSIGLLYSVYGKQE